MLHTSWHCFKKPIWRLVILTTSAVQNFFFSYNYNSFFSIRLIFFFFVKYHEYQNLTALERVDYCNFNEIISTKGSNVEYSAFGSLGGLWTFLVTFLKRRDFPIRACRVNWPPPARGQFTIFQIPYRTKTFLLAKKQKFFARGGRGESFYSICPDVWPLFQNFKFAQKRPAKVFDRFVNFFKKNLIKIHKLLINTSVFLKVSPHLFRVRKDPQAAVPKTASSPFTLLPLNLLLARGFALSRSFLALCPILRWQISYRPWGGVFEPCIFY